MEDKIGPKMEPCGTPQTTDAVEDIWLIEVLADK